MNLSKLTLPQKISAAALVVLLLSVFLPWISVSIFGQRLSKLGIEGDGVIVLILVLIGAAILVLGTELFMEPKIPAKVADIVLVSLAALTFIIVLVDFINIVGTGFAAIGIFLTFFGAIAWVAAAVWQLLGGLGVIAASGAMEVPRYDAPKADSGDAPQQ